MVKICYQYSNIQDAFDNFVKEGGMSGSYLYKTQKEKYDYISDVYNTLIVRDIVVDMYIFRQ